MNLSKSRYTKGIQCPKILWMDAHMPELFDKSVMNEAVLKTGNEVGDLAMGYYGDYIEVPFDRSDFEGMAAYTQELLEQGIPTICEATFAFDGCLCMVDILRAEDDGVHIVEVKSSTKINDINYHDMAFQTWVLQQCGLEVKSVSLMHINNQYVRQGAVDIQQLFTVEDCSDIVYGMLGSVEGNIAELRSIADAADEPAIEIGPQCKSPHECGYRGWCWRELPSPSIFDLHSLSMRRRVKYKASGIISLEDAVQAEIRMNNRQRVQAESEINGINEIIDRDAVRKFLDGLSYPLYFLDFETFQFAIPPFDGLRPYQQIPMQYSLHVLRDPEGGLEHYEFLAEVGSDPRRDVAEHLVNDIPAGVCTLAYNMSFEKGCISGMAEAYPDLAEHLLSINEGMVDLVKPFSGGHYYARAMGGSNSIKCVLPALFPDNPEFDYLNLEGVHNGGEAMALFPEMANMTPDEVARAKESLLRYCELDTYAMVKIWQKLVDAVESDLCKSIQNIKQVN